MPLPSTPRPSNARVCRRFGHGLRPITAMIMSAAAARDTRTALNAYGGAMLVANLSTPKLPPQMGAMRTRVTSVNQPPGRGSVADGPGAETPPAFECMVGKLGGPRWNCLCCGMHVSFALFADAANLSQEGKLNVLGVFDALQVATLPAVHPRAHLVVHLKGSSLDVGAHTVALRWLNPSGTELWSSSGELNVGAPPAGGHATGLPPIAPIDLPLDAAGGGLTGRSPPPAPPPPRPPPGRPSPTP